MRTVLLIGIAALLVLGCSATKAKNVKVSNKAAPVVMKYTANLGSGQSASIQQHAQTRVEEARPQMVGNLNSVANTTPKGVTKLSAKTGKKTQMKKPSEFVTRRVKQNRMPGKGLVAPREGTTGSGTSSRFVTRRIHQNRMPGKGLITPRMGGQTGGAERFVTRQIHQNRMPGKGLITPRSAEPMRKENNYTGGQARYRFKGHDQANLAD